MKIPATLYRSDNASYSETNLLNIMEYEIGELHNIDIIDTCLKLYGKQFSLYLRTQLKELQEEIENTDEIENMYQLHQILKLLIVSLSKIFKKPIKYGLWLCDSETAVDYYDGDPDDISEFPTSNIILSNLGKDGILFGYDKFPKPIY